MAQILLDTDILIAVLRSVESVALAMDARAHQGDELSYSPVSVAELWQGIRPSEEQTTRRLLHQMSCVPVNEETGRLAGQFLHRYQRSHGLLMADALIAATAALHRLPLWTMNKRHYPMPELQLLPA